MSAPAIQTIKIDAVRSVAITVQGPRVNLSLLIGGLKAVDQPIPAETSQAIGAALMLAGREAAAVQAGNA